MFNFVNFSAPYKLAPLATASLATALLLKYPNQKKNSILEIQI